MSKLNIKEHIHVDVNGREQAHLFAVVESDAGFNVTIQKSKTTTNDRETTSIDYEGFEEQTFPTKQEALEHVKAKVQTYLENAFKQT